MYSGSSSEMQSLTSVSIDLTSVKIADRTGVYTSQTGSIFENYFRLLESRISVL